MKRVPQFPEDPPSAPHTWIPLACGIAVGLWVVSLMFREMGDPPAAPARLPPPPPLPAGPGTPSPLDRSDAARLLVEAVVQVESQGNPEQVGGMGERGLMQIRESTWKEVTRRHFGREIPFDRAFEPELNREIGRRYLGDLQVFLYEHRGEWQADLRSLLLACYNAGPDRVLTAGFDLRNLPEPVRSYASRASALHDWYLGDRSEAMHDLLTRPEGGDHPP